MESHIIIVAPGGSAAYGTINDAIRAACDGDTIVLKSGTYEEKVILDKAVNIVVDSEAEPGETIVTSGLICVGPQAIMPMTELQQQFQIIGAGNALLEKANITNVNVTFPIPNSIVPISPLNYPSAIAGITATAQMAVQSLGTLHHSAGGGGSTGSPNSNFSMSENGIIGSLSPAGNVNTSGGTAHDTVTVPFPYGSITNLVVWGFVDIRCGSTVVLENCEFTAGNDGIRICTGACPTIRRCRIHNCFGGGEGVGGSASGFVSVSGEMRGAAAASAPVLSTLIDGASSQVDLVKGNTFAQGVGGGAGVYMQPGASGTVECCEIMNCRNEGIHLNGSHYAIIKDNIIHHIANGIYCRKGAQGLIENNNISNFSDFGIYLQSGSCPHVIRNQIENNCGIHAILVSKEGGGEVRDNITRGTNGGNVKIYQGCNPVLGANAIQGTLENQVPYGVPALGMGGGGVGGGMGVGTGGSFVATK